MPPITRVLVANRGEIAVRIIRACHDLGLETVLAASAPDRDSLPAHMAGRVVCIGPAPPMHSYLRVGTIVTAALGIGADAIHPGYGFLAEHPELADACAAHGLTLIGPTAENIRHMGDKLEARQTVQNLGIPVAPGSALIRRAADVMPAAQRVGFPLLLKAAAGGGGKGMKIVHDAQTLETAWQAAAAEARAAFGDDRLYLERFISNARHIEIQILADRFGNRMHLFERDCSVQRRYQKLIEEAPSPAISETTRTQLCQAALRIAAAIAFENVGTIEFLWDQDREQFYFLEMNTRIQVEHAVTECLTGVDLVQEQIRLASGEALSLTPAQVHMNGHAIECRINAEAPAADFRPSPGRLTQWQPPAGAGIRVDTHCFHGYQVPPFYDSLLAKLIVTGATRTEAIRKMHAALKQFAVSGIDTTIPFLAAVISRTDFAAGHLNTRWLQDTVCAQGANSA